MTERKKGTATSAFGVSKRESHDASDFYSRFTAPVQSDDSFVDPRRSIDDIFVGSAAQMSQVSDASVALVVTSPPYFAGKEYEAALGVGDVPATYIEYLAMLEDVFAECARTLEPGGRIAVNVANLGRRPYRSLSSDVIDILQNRLRLLMRGEVIWWKARGSAGSCAWGSFQRPANPVLRDLTERVIIASKGRFDRALSAQERARAELELPNVASMSRDEFMEATTDIWEIPPESATRVGHPAPFPVELPARLIHLYTYYDDLVLDPFMGSGTTAVAAVRTDRHYVGYDTDATYVQRAKDRIQEEVMRLERVRAADEEPLTVRLPAKVSPMNAGDEDFQARAVREGRAAREVAAALLSECHFSDIRSGVKLSCGVEVNFEARDQLGNLWYFDVSGGFTSTRPGLVRTDTLWKAIGKAAVLHETDATKAPLVLLTTDTPPPRSAGARALSAVIGLNKPIAAVLQMTSEDDITQLRQYGRSGPPRP